jgi:cobalt transporter subunit CbtB
MREWDLTVGCDGNERTDMTTKTLALAEDTADRIGILTAVLAGMMLIYFAGISHASVLHNAAHDERHALAFPCH